MPNPNKGESEKDYISRCVPIVLEEGTAKDEEQAAAICYSKFEEHQKKEAIAESVKGAVEKGFKEGINLIKGGPGSGVRGHTTDKEDGGGGKAGNYPPGLKDGGKERFDSFASVLEKYGYKQSDEKDDKERFDHKNGTDYVRLDIDANGKNPAATVYGVGGTKYAVIHEDALKEGLDTKHGKKK